MNRPHTIRSRTRIRPPLRSPRLPRKNRTELYLELLRRGYDVYIGKVDEFEVDFVAIDSRGKRYVQVCETLKDNENEILTRELNSLQKINDNYEKIILTMDKIPLSNEEGIVVRNVLEWLIDK